MHFPKGQLCSMPKPVSPQRLHLPPPATVHSKWAVLLQERTISKLFLLLCETSGGGLEATEHVAAGRNDSGEC